MFNNRMLAVAAVLIMAVPVLGAAAPVVIPTATPEQLVEGHTVFTVIEAQDAKTFNGTTRFAAAVAVLVREYASENRNVRFPGVLWFNDQYLVNPESGENNAIDYRYPCGGAVMAVNRGDPDPRVNLASVGITSGSGTTWTQTGQAPYDNVNVTVDTTATPPGVTYQSDQALSGMNVAGFGPSYKETYTIIDPNDHTWVIDRYEAYYRATQSAQNTAMFTSNVWVVNILGTAAFVPDDGTLNCQAYRDQIYDALPPEVSPMLACGGMLTRSFPTLVADDEPCAGYANPSRNGYCYSGPAMANCTQAPVRLYNAVLYFKLEHLGIEGAPRTHTTASTDTNGCEVGTEWACPAGGDDAEGNSHPFHPTTAVGHNDAEPCLGTSPAPQPNPTNHGGSASATPGSADSSGRYGPLPCDYTHATRDIDIYFSPSGRPLRPVFTNGGGVSDSQGSNAPFQNYPTAYSTTH